MEMDKVVNLDHEELAQHLHQAAEQVFRLRFQMRMGQNEGLKKLRELKKDIARMQTVERQRELGIAAPANATETKSKPAPRKTKKAAKSRSASKGARSKQSSRKTAKKTSKKTSRTAGKTKTAGRTKVKAAKRGRANAKKGGG
ncbi:MAG: 50S ribosomal protein L29 [Acidobacteriaceae bacterium]